MTTNIAAIGNIIASAASPSAIAIARIATFSVSLAPTSANTIAIATTTSAMAGTVAEVERENHVSVGDSVNIAANASAPARPS